MGSQEQVEDKTFYFYSFKISRLMIVSCEAKKKQAICNEQVSYLHIAQL